MKKIFFVLALVMLLQIAAGTRVTHAQSAGKVRLCEHVAWEGCHDYNGDTPSLGNFEDKTSSVEILDPNYKVILYEDEDYGLFLRDCQ